jgi:hypothetical protein
MPISDEELVRQLESVPLVDPGDFRESVMARITSGAAAFRPPFGRLKPATTRLYLGLAWAAAIALVIGISFFKAPVPQQNTAATMAAPEITVSRSGDRWIVQPSVDGRFEWDQTKLMKVDSLPDGSIVLKRVDGATGTAEIRLRAAGREVASTTISLE